MIARAQEEFFDLQGCKSFHTAIRTRSYTAIGEAGNTVDVTGLEQVNYIKCTQSQMRRIIDD